ncbi:MAG TPA: ankyrin repeat domain-containing protein, partial [bacterium]|nr:ankyrin repeat domain-containing protein [bacterium]
LFKCYGLGLGLVLAAAWIEEFWFRGLALPGLVKLLGPFGSIFLTSLVFGLLHAEDLTGGEFRHAMLLGSVGLGNGLLYWWTKRLNASITAHAVYNFWVVAGAFYIWLMPVQFPQALCFGAQYLDAGRVEKLIERGADLEASPDEWNTPLQTAAVHGRVDIMKVLVKHGANPFAATSNSVDAYLMAASKGQTDPVTYLLELGEKVNTATDTGETALMAAALDGRISVVEALLKRGADPNRLDKYGESALYKAVSKKHWYVARLILEGGGKPDLKGATVGATPLSHSVYCGNADMVKMMLKYGADANIVSDKGLTVFQKAIYWNKREMLRLLLSESRKRPSPKQLEALEYYARAHSGLEMAKLVRSFENPKAGKPRRGRK